MKHNLSKVTRMRRVSQLIKRWMKRLIKVTGSLLVILLLAGFIYQLVSTKMDDQKYSPPGKLVDIGGYKLHIHCTGKGSPTVVIDAGMGCNSLYWTLVQSDISKFTRVCSYDRAGNGWSDESPLERTSQNMVNELHTLLQMDSVSAPYLLVGHSFGGNNVRLYASLYPNEVSSMVLVDSSHEDQLEKMPVPSNVLISMLTNPHIAPFLASIGTTRLLTQLPAVQASMNIFPQDIQKMYWSTLSTTKFAHTVTQEFKNLPISLKHLKDAGGLLGDKPLTVISAGKATFGKDTGYSQAVSDKLNQAWQLMQNDLVTKSTHGIHRIAEHSGHMIPHEQPKIIVDAIREQIDALHLR